MKSRTTFYKWYMYLKIPFKMQENVNRARWTLQLPKSGVPLFYVNTEYLHIPNISQIRRYCIFFHIRWRAPSHFRIGNVPFYSRIFGTVTRRSRDALFELMMVMKWKKYVFEDVISSRYLLQIKTEQIQFYSRTYEWALRNITTRLADKAQRNIEIYLTKNLNECFFLSFSIWYTFEEYVFLIYK